MWNPFAAIADAISKPVTQYVKNRGEVKKAEHDLAIAELKLKSKLMISDQSHNQQWEIEALKNKVRSPMQWISFLALGAPFIIAWFNPAIVATYFTTSLAVIPEWYIQLFVSIIGVIWGIAQVKNVASGIKQSIMENNQMKATIAATTANISNVKATVEGLFKIIDDGEERVLSESEVLLQYGEDYLKQLKENVM